MSLSPYPHLSEHINIKINLVAKCDLSTHITQVVDNKVPFLPLFGARARRPTFSQSCVRSACTNDLCRAFRRIGISTQLFGAVWVFRGRHRATEPHQRDALEKKSNFCFHCAKDAGANFVCLLYIYYYWTFSRFFLFLLNAIDVRVYKIYSIE